MGEHRGPLIAVGLLVVMAVVFCWIGATSLPSGPYCTTHSKTVTVDGGTPQTTVTKECS